MSGALDWLDSLAAGVTNVAGKAVDVVGAVATAKATQAAQTAQTQTEAQTVQPIASAQVSVGGNTLLWVGIGAAVLIGAIVLMRR